MIRNYYIDIEDEFERPKLEAYLLDHGMKFFDATKLDPYTSMDPQTMTIKQIRADITTTRTAEL